MTIDSKKALELQEELKKLQKWEPVLGCPELLAHLREKIDILRYNAHKSANQPSLDNAFVSITNLARANELSILLGYFEFIKTEKARIENELRT